MRSSLSGIAAMALVAISTSVAVAAPSAMSVAMMHGSHMMPKCTPTTGPVVWWMASTKTYYLKGASMYGKGMGVYACRAAAVARGGKPGKSMMHGGSMTHGDSMPHGGAMPPAMTMAPRPMSTSGSMPSGSTSAPMPMGNAAPGAQSNTPVPASSGNPMSGNQGNTGAPGAGGQVPNNPASTSNSNPNPGSPSPRPSPRP